MKDRKELAIEKRNQGCNCAQAVACAFCDKTGMDEGSLVNITAALGLGMGNMEGTCGALTGAAVVLGLAAGQVTGVPVAKQSRELMEKFAKRNGSVLCRELKGRDSGEVLRSCPDCIRDACEFLEEILENN